MVNTSNYYDQQSIAIQNNPKWGRFATWLVDGSKIRFKPYNSEEWINATVLDDRVYYTGAGYGNVNHVTMTTEGSIDFIINREGESDERSSFMIDVKFK